MSMREQKTKHFPSQTVAGTVICHTCGADYPAALPNCPYCGTANEPAAEARYMNSLEDIRKNMAALESTPSVGVRHHFRRLWKRLFLVIIAVLLIIAVALVVHLNEERQENQNNKAEYLWQHEHFAEMEELYRAGSYEELARYYIEASEAGHQVYQFRHHVFCDHLVYIMNARECLEEYNTWEPDSPLSLFMAELYLYRLDSVKGLSEEEHNTLDHLQRDLLTDFEERFRLSAEELDPLLQKLKADDWLSYSDCEKLLLEKGLINGEM